MPRIYRLSIPMTAEVFNETTLGWEATPFVFTHPGSALSIYADDADHAREKFVDALGRLVRAELDGEIPRKP